LEEKMEWVDCKENLLRQLSELGERISCYSRKKEKVKGKVKISLLQAVEAHRVARGQGSHIT
jgi:hypothetical protein